MKCVALIFFWAAAVVAIAQDDPFSKGEAMEKAVQEDDTFKVFPDPAGEPFFAKGKASYFTRYLSAMKEPSLQRDLAEGTKTVFRFTYLRSFDDPITVRIWQKGDVFEARAVRLKMNREYRPLEIIHDRSFRIDPEKLEKIRSELEKKDFWKPLTNDELMLEGLDGSRWIFELHDNNGYKMIDVWSPGSTPLDDVLKRAGIDPKSLRDFVTYKRVGIEILKQGGVLPKEDNQY